MRYKVRLKAHHLQRDSERELTDSCSFPLDRRSGVFWFSRLRQRFFVERRQILFLLHSVLSVLYHWCHMELSRQQS